jgi:uncharacterized membrane protein
MAKSPMELASDAQESAFQRESAELRQQNIEPMTQEAVPRYVAGIRSDLIAVMVLIGVLVTYARVIVGMLILIAAILIWRHF